MRESDTEVIATMRWILMAVIGACCCLVVLTDWLSRLSQALAFLPFLIFQFPLSDFYLMRVYCCKDIA
jgi:hypothetical protein